MTRACACGNVASKISRGMCNSCYARWYRTLDAPLTKPMTRAERFWTHVDKTETCWLWTGAIYGTGYGAFSIGGGRQCVAHRYAYQIVVGPIPTGLTLDHLCRVRHCVNPDHLEPVTGRENILRGDTFQARNAAKTHCPQGHEYTPENTYIRVITKHPTPYKTRSCRTCRREQRRARTERERATS